MKRKMQWLQFSRNSKNCNNTCNERNISSSRRRIMDKAADSAATTTTTTNTRYKYHRKLNKISHKISKPPSAFTRPSIESHTSGLDSNQQQNHLQQPPVYYVSKSDFREVVQKLTGSLAHQRPALSPPIHPSMPPNSRLHQIRPPPLSQLANRTPPLLNATRPQVLNHNLENQSQIQAPVPLAAANSNSGDGSFLNQISRPVAPLSSLPPIPEVHAAAESPVSAYMRYLQSESTASESNSYQFTGFSPLPPIEPFLHSPPQQFQLPMSPLPFGQLNSPNSPYPLLFSSASGFPLSPTSGFPLSLTSGFQLSPTLPKLSPKRTFNDNS